MKPFLKWAGSKSKLTSQLVKLVPNQFGKYYEPFLGSGALLFHLQPEKAMCNDVNEELITTYQIVRDNPSGLIDILRAHQLMHSKSHYYKVRENNFGSHLMRAARFIYLNKTCFNGLYRVNLKGDFNVPMGNYKNPKIFDSDNIKEVSQYLQNLRLTCQDFESSLRDVEIDDFVYLDPPYLPISNTSNFTAYTKDNFDINDQFRVKRLFLKLSLFGVKVLLSNSDSPLIREIYKDFNITEIKVNRSINSDKNGRKQITELAIRNY